MVGARVGRELRYLGIVAWGVGRGTVDVLMRLGTRRVDSPFADFRRQNEVGCRPSGLTLLGAWRKLYAGSGGRVMPSFFIRK